jgi:hypothetical protein
LSQSHYDINGEQLRPARWIQRKKTKGLKDGGVDECMKEKR